MTPPLGALVILFLLTLFPTAGTIRPRPLRAGRTRRENKTERSPRPLAKIDYYLVFFCAARPASGRARSLGLSFCCIDKDLAGPRRLTIVGRSDQSPACVRVPSIMFINDIPPARRPAADDFEIFICV